MSLWVNECRFKLTFGHIDYQFTRHCNYYFFFWVIFGNSIDSFKMMMHVS